MLIYKIIKDKLEDKDLESASRIECDDNNIVGNQLLDDFLGAVDDRVRNSG